MEVDEQWSLIHKYQRLVEDQKATAFTCHSCGEVVYPEANVETDLSFECFFCNSKIRPNALWWDSLKKRIIELNA